MDMGVLKPFEFSRAASSVPVEAGVSSRPAGKQTEATQVVPASLPADSQKRDAEQPTETGTEINREQLQAAVADIQDFVQSVRRDINFQLDDNSGRMVINVTEASSGDVIRQIPSEEALRLAENLSEVRSLLFEAEA